MKEYGVAESKIRLWCKQQDSLLKIPTKRDCKFVSSLPELEGELNEWSTFEWYKNIHIHI